MSNVLVQESSLQAIADAIRYKTGGNETYKPREMATAIRSLSGAAVLQSLNVTENGSYAPNLGVDGFSSVSVAVPGGFSSSDEGKVVVNGVLTPQTSLNVSANGTYDTTAKNSVVVNVSSGSSSTAILSGVNTPSSSLGSDGNIYLQYYDINFLCNKEYLVIETTQLLANHSAAFYKTVRGPAIAVHWKNSTGHYGPLLLSTVADYAKYTMNTDIRGSLTVDGITWYLCGGNYWTTSQDSPSIPTLYTGINFNNIETTIRTILNAAEVVPGHQELVTNVFAKVNGTWRAVGDFDVTNICGVS